jgi:hypothetical protein
MQKHRALLSNKFAYSDKRLLLDGGLGSSQRVDKNKGRLRSCDRERREIPANLGQRKHAQVAVLLIEQYKARLRLAQVTAAASLQRCLTSTTSSTAFDFSSRAFI